MTHRVEILRRMLGGVGPNRLLVDGAVLLAGTVVAVPSPPGRSPGG